MVGSVLKRWQIAIGGRALHPARRDLRFVRVAREFRHPARHSGVRSVPWDGTVRLRSGPQPPGRAQAFETNRIGERSPPRSRRAVEGAGGQQPGGHLHGRCRRCGVASQRRRAPSVRPCARHSSPAGPFASIFRRWSTSHRPHTNGPSFRTVMQCRGQRADGEAFLADIWFSTYRTSVGSRLAAMVVDTSEDLAQSRRVQPAPTAGRVANSGGRGLARSSQRLRSHRARARESGAQQLARA